MIMTNNNTNRTLTFIEKVKTNEIKCHKLPNHGREFSGYREKISIYNFSEYLYSLRHLYDAKNSGGAYLGD